MNGFLYGAVLQWKLDIRSKSLLVTCYIVPLIFFLLMGGIFTSVMPEMGSTLIQSMIVMGVSMGAFIGLPPSLIETGTYFVYPISTVTPRHIKNRSFCFPPCHFDKMLFQRSWRERN